MHVLLSLSPWLLALAMCLVFVLVLVGVLIGGTVTVPGGGFQTSGLAPLLREWRRLTLSKTRRQKR
ncbi:hypothetical protein [Pseudoprimorskyibacter insulae]|uniref:hypothetical protein n=1 Tax=Pseudoprimorskyibacter insulae TaxID=1695997 RepID=UPI0011B27ACA|nr:hypothetical protein [Pseudoprimorskyibacter insulae]